MTFSEDLASELFISLEKNLFVHLTNYFLYDGWKIINIYFIEMYLVEWVPNIIVS